VQHEDFRAFFVMLLVQMQNVIAAISSSSTQVRKQFACFARIVLLFLSRLWCSSDALQCNTPPTKTPRPSLDI
jgi:hypothetical protein